MTAIPKTTVLTELKRGGMQIRPNKSVSADVVLQQKFKSSAPPPYGFTYIGARLEKDAKEYSTLLVVHQQWQSGTSATAIAHYLNSKNFKTRMQKDWSRNVILNIIQRFENKSITLEGSTI